MVDVSGVPNLGIPGLSGFSGGAAIPPQYVSNGLSNAYQQQAQNNAYFGRQANTLSQAQVPQEQLYGGGSFGAQPAYYAGVGAAYGRATGGFGGRGQSVFESGAPPVPYTEGPFQSASSGGGVGSSLPTLPYQNPFTAPASFEERWGGFGRGQSASPASFSERWGGFSSEPAPPSYFPTSNVGSGNPFTGGAAPVPEYGGPFQSASAGGGIGANAPSGLRDRIASIMMGSEGNAGAENMGRFGGSAGPMPTAPPPPLSEFGGSAGPMPTAPPPPSFGSLPTSSVFERFRGSQASPMGGASPPPPALGGGWGTSTHVPTGEVGSSELLGGFAGRSPQSQIESRFGEMQPPVWSPGGIVMGDRLRAMGMGR